MNLRTDYLRSPIMDQVARSHASAHTLAGHSLSFRPSLEEMPLCPPPDVVFHEAVSEAPYGPLTTTCMVAALVPDSTLLVPSFQHMTPSARMLATHILRGKCHPRVVLHRPHDQHDEREFIEAVERCVRGDPQIETAGPVAEIRFEGGSGLGEIMEQSRFGRMLFTAATNPTWAKWRELAELMHVAPGVARNTSTDLGKALKRHGIIGQQETWSASRFSQLVATYSLFVIGYWLGHHGLDRDLVPEVV